MATRRPRIKPVVNVSSLRRRPTIATSEATIIKEESPACLGTNEASITNEEKSKDSSSMSQDRDTTQDVPSSTHKKNSTQDTPLTQEKDLSQNTPSLTEKKDLPHNCLQENDLIQNIPSVTQENNLVQKIPSVALEKNSIPLIKEKCNNKCTLPLLKDVDTSKAIPPLQPPDEENIISTTTSHDFEQSSNSRINIDKEVPTLQNNSAVAKSATVQSSHAIKPIIHAVKVLETKPEDGLASSQKFLIGSSTPTRNELSQHEESACSSSADEGKKPLLLLNRLHRSKIKPNIHAATRKLITLPPSPMATQESTLAKALSVEAPPPPSPLPSLLTEVHSYQQTSVPASPLPVVQESAPNTQGKTELSNPREASSSTAPISSDKTPHQDSGSSSGDELYDTLMRAQKARQRQYAKKGIDSWSSNNRKSFKRKKILPNCKPTIMHDLLFSNPVGQPMKYSDDELDLNVKKPKKGSRLQEEDVDNDGLEPGASNKAEGSEEESDAEMKGGGMPAPQVKVVNGQVVLDEQSLIIETTAAKKGRKFIEKAAVNRESVVSYKNYGRCSKGNRKEWTDKELIFFYKVLNTIGSDFTMMTTFFPTRTRRELKLKFKKEERVNPHLIRKALEFPSEYDPTELEEEFKEVEEQAQLEREAKKARSTKAPQNTKRKKRRNRNYHVRSDYYFDSGESCGEDDPKSLESSSSHSIKTERETKVAPKIDTPKPELVPIIRPVAPPVSPPSSTSKSKNAVSDEDFDESSDDNDSDYTRKSPIMTRSVRVSKLPRVSHSKSASEEELEDDSDEDPVNKFRAKPQSSYKKKRAVRQVKTSNQTTVVHESNESVISHEPSSNLNSMTSLEMPLTNIEPGSLVVIKTPAPGDPTKELIQVYMVPPLSGITQADVNQLKNVELDCHLPPVDQGGTTTIEISSEDIATMDAEMAPVLFSL